MRWVFFFAVVGCARGGESDRNTPGPSTLGPATSAGTETPVMGSTEDDGDEESTSSGAPLPGSTSDSSSTGAPITTDPAGSSSSGGEPICIEDAQDDMCITCIKQSCCPEYDACVDDETCNCALECIAEGMMPAEDCASACGTTAAVTELFVCGYLSCKLDCQGI